MSSACKCGKRLVWGTDSAGKRHPLDASAPVFELIGDPQRDLLGAPVDAMVERTRRAFVTHFATCPLANQFSSSAGGPTREQRLDALLARWVEVAMGGERADGSLGALIDETRAEMSKAKGGAGGATPARPRR